MSGRTNVLIIGDSTDAPYHPLEPAYKELNGILGGEFELEATEDYDRLTELWRNQAAYPLCISYTDCWNRDIKPEQTAGLLRYVAGGGGLLVIHNGISLQRSHELLQMIGAKFVTHPPFQRLSYYPAAEGHPLLEGVAPFTVDEEPYVFDFDPFTRKKVFLEYEFEGNRYPAGWEHTYGLGRVVYLQPGHRASSFGPEAYRRLVLNGARWASGRLGAAE
ncbi:ThuA domain-containing protein [Paenibacillus hamazuiensis]|uniref:ThuA domain-containing protein n=1 Tax=Paenibacillus hamazuiensis TaxID=2936508 RepID=UPI00200D6614|nr:ThuA domain-containing protein [Paenibacillus hamazuiensis]